MPRVAAEAWIVLEVFAHPSLHVRVRESSHPGSQRRSKFLRIVVRVGGMASADHGVTVNEVHRASAPTLAQVRRCKRLQIESRTSPRRRSVWELCLRTDRSDRNHAEAPSRSSYCAPSRLPARVSNSLPSGCWSAESLRAKVMKASRPEGADATDTQWSS